MKNEAVIFLCLRFLRFVSKALCASKGNLPAIQAVESLPTSMCVCVCLCQYVCVCWCANETYFSLEIYEFTRETCAYGMELQICIIKQIAKKRVYVQSFLYFHDFENLSMQCWLENFRLHEMFVHHVAMSLHTTEGSTKSIKLTNYV